jgi:hypothetical protein
MLALFICWKFGDEWAVDSAVDSAHRTENVEPCSGGVPLVTIGSSLLSMTTSCHAKRVSGEMGSEKCMGGNTTKRVNTTYVPCILYCHMKIGGTYLSYSCRGRKGLQGPASPASTTYAMCSFHGVLVPSVLDSYGVKGNG